MATKTQITEFINKISPVVIQVCKERGYGDIQAWTCICQGGLESNWGTSSLMKNAKAYFGIKATQSWVKAAKYGGLVYSSKTKECYDGKTYTSITDTFRAYKDDIDSIRDYFDLLEGNRYKACLSPNVATVKECITIIKNGGYATDPNYINSICKTFTTHQEEIVRFSVGGKITPQIVNDITNVTLYPTLKKGMKSAYVSIAQHKLNEHLKCNLKEDSAFGQQTEIQVIAFQSLHGLKKDGIIGQQTWKSLMR